MAAILRLAGGFDRSHTQQVQAVIVCRDADGLEMRVVAAELPEVDIWGARRRAEFFEKVFKTQLTITWQTSTRPGLASQPADQEDDVVSKMPLPPELEESPLEPAATDEAPHQDAAPPTNGSANGQSAAENGTHKRRKKRQAGRPR